MAASAARAGCGRRRSRPAPADRLPVGRAVDPSRVHRRGLRQSQQGRPQPRACPRCTRRRGGGSFLRPDEPRPGARIRWAQRGGGGTSLRGCRLCSRHDHAALGGEQLGVHPRPDRALRGGARPAEGAPAAVTEPGGGRHRRGKNTARHGGDGRRAGDPGPDPEPRARRRRHGVRAARGGRHPRRGPGIARPLWRGGGRRARCRQIRRRARGRCRGTGALAAASRTLPGGDHGSPVRRGPRADARSGPPSAATAGRCPVGRGVGQIPRSPRTPCRGGQRRAPTPPGPCPGLVRPTAPARPRHVMPAARDRSRCRDRSRRQGAGGRGALRIVPRCERRRHRPGRAGRAGPDRQARF